MNKVTIVIIDIIIIVGIISSISIYNIIMRQQVFSAEW